MPSRSPKIHLTDTHDPARSVLMILCKPLHNPPPVGRMCWRKTLIRFGKQAPNVSLVGRGIALSSEPDIRAPPSLKIPANLVSKSGQIYRISSNCHFPVENTGNRMHRGCIVAFALVRFVRLVMGLPGEQSRFVGHASEFTGTADDAALRYAPARHRAV